MMSKDICLRACHLADLGILVKIYREGFENELSFFFRRFCKCFFESLFRHLIRDTIVAEVGGQVVGFIIVILGPIPIARASIFQFMFTLPLLLTVARSSFFICILQKAKSMDWTRCQVGIGCIAVKRELQGKGVGGVLMREGLARYPGRNVILDVRPWNGRAVRLYTGVGFKRIGVWRDPLGAWIVMKRAPNFLHVNKVDNRPS
jgi:ribosomal protein S18 acetylase RimI-like enzyme